MRAEGREGQTRVVLMGVSGSGKTALGHQLSARTGWPFLDGDDFHTPEARARMAAGLGLSDADRAPWLTRLRGQLLARAEVVLACSSLRRTYRDVLRVPAVRFVSLDVPVELLSRRLLRREDHYAHLDLLPSQLQTLEPPQEDETDVLTLPVTAHDSPADLARRTLDMLGLKHAG